MVHGSHVIFSAYGFWLPNDPRGSWSDFIGAWELLRFGDATKVETHRSVAGRPHDRGVRLAAKKVLKRPAVDFNGVQCRAIGEGFKTLIEEDRITFWACTILPQHVHLVVARHRHEVKRMVNLLKGSATRQLVEEGMHPFQKQQSPEGDVPKCWARGEWKVYLDSEADIRRALRYVERNPLKEGKPVQRWSYVTPFAGLRSMQ